MPNMVVLALWVLQEVGLAGDWEIRISPLEVIMARAYMTKLVLK